MQFATPFLLCFVSLILTATSSSPDFEARHVYPPLQERGGVLSSNKSPPLPKDTLFGGIECSGTKMKYCKSRCHCSVTGRIICQKKHKNLAAPTITFLETKLTAIYSPKCQCKMDGGTIHGGTTYGQWSKFVRDQGQGWGNQKR